MHRARRPDCPSALLVPAQPQPAPLARYYLFVLSGAFRPLHCHLKVIPFIYFVDTVLKPNEIPFALTLQQISHYAALTPAGDVADRLNVITLLECRHSQNYMTMPQATLPGTNASASTSPGDRNEDGDFLIDLYSYEKPRSGHGRIGLFPFLNPLPRSACSMTTKPDPVPVIVTDTSFKQAVLDSILPVLLDMWTPWSQASLALASVMEELASELAGKVKVAKINIEDNTATAVEFGVRSIPTILIFKDGQVVHVMAGPQSKAAILEKLKAVIG